VLGGHAMTQYASTVFGIKNGKNNALMLL